MKNYRTFLKEDFQEQSEFVKTCWWLEEIYDWDYVESEGLGHMRFDWSGGKLSFWLNDDISGEGQLTGEGQIPNKIKDDIEKRGIKINN